MWWSKDGSKLAFLHFDDRKVLDYQIQLFEGKNAKPAVKQYPDESALKYPKPGTPNPVVQLLVYTMASTTMTNVPLPAFREKEEPDNQIIYDINWLPSSDGFLVKVMNRRQDARRMLHVAVNANTTEVTVRIHRDETVKDGWFEGVCCSGEFVMSAHLERERLCSGSPDQTTRTSIAFQTTMETFSSLSFP